MSEWSWDEDHLYITNLFHTAMNCCIQGHPESAYPLSRSFSTGRTPVHEFDRSTTMPCQGHLEFKRVEERGISYYRVDIGSDPVTSSTFKTGQGGVESGIKEAR